MLNGYDEAAKIDKLINDLLVTYGIVKENHLEWAKFTRTIRTGLDLIEESASWFIPVRED